MHDGREAFDQALAALTPLDAAQHSQRKADMPTKREVSMVGKLADTAFDDPQSGIDLNLAETAAKVRSQSVSVASALQAYAPWKKADQELAPFIVEQVKADFIAFVEAFEVELGVTLTKNRRGFPVGPFKPDEEEDDIIRLCGRILICFIEECDEENEDDPNGSPYGVLILIILNEVLFGFRDPLGGFLLDWTFRKYSPTRPTVVAHCYHGVPGRFGLSTPFPKSLSDWNPREMTVRVEAHCTNFLIASHSYAALVRMMQESRVAAEKIRLVLHAQGLMEEPIPLPDFLPSAEFRGLVRFNGVLPFEAKLLFTEEHKPRPGAADASDLYHPRLVEVITKLGLQLPRRDPDVVASIGDFTVTSMIVDTTGRRRAGRRQASTPREALNDEELLAQVEKHYELRGTKRAQYPTHRIVVRGWTPIGVALGVSPERAKNRWRSLMNSYYTCRHLIKWYEFIWDEELQRPVAPSSA